MASELHVDYTSPVNVDVSRTLEEAVYRYVCLRPGVDAEDVADAFGIHPAAACDTIEALLNQGRLGFDGE